MIHESDAARQLPVALNRISVLEDQLKGIGHGYHDVEMRTALSEALVGAALANENTTNTLQRVERVAEDATARQVGRAEREVEKLRLSNESLQRQLSDENAQRLANIASVELERAETKAKIRS